MSDSDSSDSDFDKSYGNDILPYETLLSSLLKDRFLCDVTICVHTSTIPAHRVILSAASSFFLNLFNNTESINKEYDLTEIFIKPQNLDQIITYIYKGIVNINYANVASLLTVNKALKISSLNNHCAQFILSRLRPMNVFDIWQFAWEFNLQELTNVSLIVCRETLSDSMLIKYDIIRLCEEFLSHLLATEEVLTSVSPDSVVYMLSWWTTYRSNDFTERTEKMLSFLDIYLKWKVLSKTEFKLVRTLTYKCFEFDPVLIHRITSWSRTKFPDIDEDDVESNNEETTADKLRSLNFLNDWSLLVTESDVEFIGIYCNAKSRWFTMELEDDPLKLIGFKNNSLVIKPDSNNLLLRNVDRTAQQNVPSKYTNDDFVRCVSGQPSTFFMHADNIYSVDAVLRTNEKDMVCIINKLDDKTHNWITVLHLNPKLSNDILSVSLTVETYNSDDVYLFMAVRRPQRENPRNSTTFTGSCVTSFGDENLVVYRKSVETFYVFCIDMKYFTYRLIGERVNEPSDLSTNRKIILKDKIIFLLDPDKDLERKFGHAYYNRNYCFLTCLELILHGANTWKNLSLRAPFPDVRDISIRKRYCTRLECSVTTYKNLLFVGVQWCPHVFQVFMYDISTFTVSSLPSIPLSATRRMSISALFTSKPISDFLNGKLRFTDLMKFHFTDWSLLSWDGMLM